MPQLTPMDEYFLHQIPEPLTSVETHHDFWRESVFFIAHPPEGLGDIISLTTAHFPKAEKLEAMQLGRIGDDWIFKRFERPYDGDPHTMRVGPTLIDITDPYKTIKLEVVDDGSGTVPYAMDLTFTGRGREYGLRRGTMKAGHELIWDQSHMLQSGTYSGTITKDGVTTEIDNWWGQRDHSWGIRDHSRCPLWMWLAIQTDEGMFGVWHWEYPNGARVYTDGCFSPSDGSDPIPVVDFNHDDLHWTGADGNEVSYGQFGLEVRGLAGHVDITLEGGRKIGFDAVGRWAFPYGPMGGGLSEMTFTSSEGHTGTAIYEVTGAHHHKFFPIKRDAGLIVPQSH
jgi:hypothetical protein